ncbi:MAG TPA: carboxylating nicotinate-nucleotide diphosphorylase [Mariprofundaceae bacterium]|nr:carboxylating nicotinate-nucleotide diphosphorylase [Mariprofundaceae bacterium]
MIDLIQTALAEDAALRDLTAQATIPAEQQGTAVIRAKAAGILSGTAVAGEVFRQVDAAIAVQWHRHDGEAVAAGETICALSGPLRALLAAERTALNFLQHLSGIATATHAYVQAVAGTGCAIFDTRKTTPGLRKLEKQAVGHGGGHNHRMDLASGLLIKENHIAACGSLSRAVLACRKTAGTLWVEVECETLAEVQEAVGAGPDMILLDNMTPDMVRQARELIPHTMILEASGGITLANARAYAEAGADRLAIGAITHSAAALDLSMRVS